MNTEELELALRRHDRRRSRNALLALLFIVVVAVGLGALRNLMNSVPAVRTIEDMQSAR